MESANNIDLPNVFVVRVENKIPIENLQSLYLRVMQSDSAKTTPPPKKNHLAEGGGVQCANPGSTFKLKPRILLLQRLKYVYAGKRAVRIADLRGGGGAIP